VIENWGQHFSEAAWAQSWAQMGSWSTRGGGDRQENEAKIASDTYEQNKFKFVGERRVLEMVHANANG
jgi:hypothetical protein